MPGLRGSSQTCLQNSLFFGPASAAGTWLPVSHFDPGGEGLIFPERHFRFSLARALPVALSTVLPVPPPPPVGHFRLPFQAFLCCLWKSAGVGAETANPGSVWAGGAEAQAELGEGQVPPGGAGGGSPWSPAPPACYSEIRWARAPWGSQARLPGSNPTGTTS